MRIGIDTIIGMGIGTDSNVLVRVWGTGAGPCIGTGTLHNMSNIACVGSRLAI